ncbi:MAG: ABC transporter permease [Synergistaceae bacterium]|nr:ABC transporter permease [Synergistaceae bacterium]
MEKFRCTWLVLGFFAVWEIVPRAGLVSPLLLPPFSQVIASLFEIIYTGQLFVDLSASLKRSLLGFFLSVLVGIPLGFLTGWYKKFEQYTDLLSQGFRNTSTFALMPIFLLFFGLGETSKIAIVFWGSVWGILINTTSGVKTIDPIYVKAAKSLGLSDFDMFVKVILPASVPAIVSGMRVSAKTAFMVIIAAEMMGAKSGIGFYIQNAQYNFMIPEMYAGILVLSVLGVTLNYSLILLEKKATSWRGEIDSAIIG